MENQGTGGSKMETEGLQVYWNAGDRVGIKYNTYPITLNGGNASVENIPPLYNFYICQPPNGWTNNPITFNAYYPPSIAAYDEEFLSSSFYQYNTSNHGTGVLSVTLPSRYESSFADNRQRIQLPMIGTYYYYRESRNPNYSTTKFPMGREVLRFQHLTAALLVKVRNDSGLPLLVDRVAVSSGYYKLSGTTAVDFIVGNPIDYSPGLHNSEEALANFAANYYREISVHPMYAGTEADRQVEVVFPEPVVVAPGDTLPVQVPVLPLGPYGLVESLSRTDNLTVRVEGRNESAPGVVGSRQLTFQHTVEITRSIGRNVMKTIQIKMDPASERVTVSEPTAFSINAGGNKVLFSKGNLQYNKLTSTWSFMEHQWSTVEYDGQDVSDDYANQPIVSLFGWGTSGHPYPQPQILYQPYNTDAAGAYGPAAGVLGGTYDWGYNAIANGGNAEGSGWRTLTGEEWAYLLGDNLHRQGKWGRATLGGTHCGLVLLPDHNWVLPDGLSFTPGNGYASNEYTLEQWGAMEAAGAVFLPAVGQRAGSQVYTAGNYAFYWSATNGSSSVHAKALFFIDDDLQPQNDNGRSLGAAVRLVRSAD